jgi:hypothetical protein
MYLYDSVVGFKKENYERQYAASGQSMKSMRDPLVGQIRGFSARLGQRVSLLSMPCQKVGKIDLLETQAPINWLFADEPYGGRHLGHTRVLPANSPGHQRKS